MEDLIEMQIESTIENGLEQRGCATVVNDEMMYFGGLFNPKQVCFYSNITIYNYNIIFVFPCVNPSI